MRISLCLIVLILLSINIISAEIMLSQPKSIYNLGDNLEISAEVKSELNGPLRINLFCENSGVNLFNSPDKEVNINIPLTLSYFKNLEFTLGDFSNLRGQCNIMVSFSEENKQTQSFEISDKIDVILNVDNMSVDAGEKIILKGSSLKENSDSVNGFVEITVEGTDIEITRMVANGNFEANFSFPERMKSGEYVLNAKVYEKLYGEETNKGEESIILNVKKKPSKIEIAVSRQNINPGEDLIFSPIIYDQADEDIIGEVDVKIYDSEDNVFFQEILASNHWKTIPFETNEKAGYWKIVGKALNLKTERLFYVEELEKSKFELINDTLTVTNIGNVAYRKPVQISIGQVTEIKDVDLDIGESKRFRLTGQGEYDVGVTDGKETFLENSVSLTGNVVGVKNVRGKSFFSSRYPVVWFFLISVFGLFIIVLIQRVSKKKFYAFSPKNRGIIKEGKNQIKKDILIPSPSQVEKAEHSLVLNGRKENSGIITVKLKDIENLRKTSLETINNITKAITNNRGAVYEISDYLMGIFSSTTTKTFKNDLLTVKASKEINEILKEHNKKFKEKINYGISLNSGELIVKKEPNKLKFTSLGNSMNLSKKIANLARDEILLGEEMQKRIIGQIRADKEVREGINVYHIKDIIDRNKNKAFISDFLNRLGKETKKR